MSLIREDLALALGLVLALADIGERFVSTPALVCDTEAPSLIMLARTIIYFMQ